jgi:hypothetical protein
LLISEILLPADQAATYKVITGQVLPTNPAAVRDPKHLVKTGKPPILKGAEWRKLLDSIPATTLAISVVRALSDRRALEFSNA